MNRAEPWSIVGHGSARFSALHELEGFVRIALVESRGPSGASPHQGSSLDHSSTIAASFKTVFQLRPVAGVPNFFSISLAVNLDCPTPAG